MLTRLLFSGDPAVVLPLVALLWFAAGAVAGWQLGRTPARRRDRRRSKPSRPPRPAGRTKAVEMYVGNLPYDAGEKELQQLLKSYGQVASVRIIRNRLSGKSRGYAFVAMSDGSLNKAVIEGLNGKELEGRRLVVNEAKSRAR